MPKAKPAAKKPIRKSGDGFLSARRLKVPPRARDGLIKFLKNAEAGKIAKESHKITCFDMKSIICIRGSCGTAACIGGWAAIFALGLKVNAECGWEMERKVINLFERWDDYNNLNCLFQARDSDSAMPPLIELSEIDLAWATRVTRKFLETSVVDYTGTRYAS